MHQRQQQKSKRSRGSSTSAALPGSSSEGDDAAQSRRLLASGACLSHLPEALASGACRRAAPETLRECLEKKQSKEAAARTAHAARDQAGDFFHSRRRKVKLLEDLQQRACLSDLSATGRLHVCTVSPLGEIQRTAHGQLRSASGLKHVGSGDHVEDDEFPQAVVPPRESLNRREVKADQQTRR